MSADNGIYVLASKTSDVSEGIGVLISPLKEVWRVAHAQAIENFDYYREERPDEFDEYLKYVWGASEVFASYGDALVAAHNLADKYPVLEYGVSVLNLEDYRFPGD